MASVEPWLNNPPAVALWMLESSADLLNEHAPLAYPMLNHPLVIRRIPLQFSSTPRLALMNYHCSVPLAEM
jgi:hypothetical protein